MPSSLSTLIDVPFYLYTLAFCFPLSLAHLWELFWDNSSLRNVTGFLRMNHRNLSPSTTTIAPPLQTCPLPWPWVEMASPWSVNGVRSADSVPRKKSWFVVSVLLSQGLWSKIFQGKSYWKVVLAERQGQMRRGWVPKTAQITSCSGRNGNSVHLAGLKMNFLPHT